MARWQQVEYWVKNKSPKAGAEIGVKEGRFISHMLSIFPMLTMYAIDPWENQPEGNENYIGWDWLDIYARYKKAIHPYQNRVIELREYSITAANKIEDGSLDFVFIDAQHDYESVSSDIDLWLPKIRSGGLLSGHDHDNNFPGVVRAVSERFDHYTVGSNAVWGVWC